MKKLTLFLAILALLLSLSAVSFAHSGRTDGSGGHWNHSTGEYHYHHGKPAHDHINGVCPYDYEDTASHLHGTKQNRSPSPSRPKNESTLKWWQMIIIGGCAAWFLGHPAGSVLCILWYLLSRLLKFDYKLLPEWFFFAIGIGTPIVITIIAIVKQVIL